MVSHGFHWVSNGYIGFPRVPLVSNVHLFPMDFIGFPTDLIGFPTDFIGFAMDFIGIPMEFTVFPMDFNCFPMGPIGIPIDLIGLVDATAISQRKYKVARIM